MTVSEGSPGSVPMSAVTAAVEPALRVTDTESLWTMPRES